MSIDQKDDYKLNKQLVGSNLMKMTARTISYSKSKSKTSTVYNKLMLLDEEDKLYAGMSYKVFIVPKNSKGNYSSSIGGSKTDPIKVLVDASNNFLGVNLQNQAINKPLDKCFSNLRFTALTQTHDLKSIVNKSVKLLKANNDFIEMDSNLITYKTCIKRYFIYYVSTIIFVVLIYLIY